MALRRLFHRWLLLNSCVLFLSIRAQELLCDNEPWGRYSASGGLYQNYLYSLGGDTSSVADEQRGGVVRTNFRFNLETRCWERIIDSPVAIGYRATATLLNGDFYVFGGGNPSFQAVDHFWKLSLSEQHTWTGIPSETSIDQPSARYKHAAVKLSETTMFLHGGRQGNVVLSDAWVFNITSMQWTSLGNTGVTAYRHGMAYDTTRNVVWVYGGLDGTFSRTSVLHQLNLSVISTRTSPIQYSGSPPGRRASHALEYVPELDSLILYGGTCDDESDLFLYNITDNSWCSLSPAMRPSRRDAMLWAFDFPMFYMYSGDVICVAIGDVYSIADVHALNLTNPKAWDLLYKPYNERAPYLVDICNGTNARMCRTPPFLTDITEGQSTCTIAPDMSTQITLPTGMPSPVTTTTTIAPNTSASIQASASWTIYDLYVTVVTIVSLVLCS